MKNFFNWLTTSSTDPLRTSLAVKGALMWGVALIVQFAPLACSIATALCIDATQLNPIVDAIVNIAKTGLELVASTMTVVGLIRKVYLGRWAHPAA